MTRARVLVLASLAAGCPASRDPADKAPSPSGSAAPAPAPLLQPGPASVPSIQPVALPDERVVPLIAGQPLAAEAQGEGDAFGVELLFDARLLVTSPPPLHLGATATTIAAASGAASGGVRVTLGAGRARLRFGPRTFAMDEGWELRSDRRRAGAVLLSPQAGAATVRVVPTGALRPLLSERRFDVVPLAPTQLTSLPDPPPHRGRKVVRTKVVTAWGVLELDQMPAPTMPRPSPKTDARGDVDVELQGLDGAGESLCRLLVELVAADRAASGPPCSPALVPLRAELQFALGGGLLLDATSVREGPVARSDLALSPVGARMSSSPLPDPKQPFAPSESLLSLRSKGESTSFDLVNKAPAPRLALIDGVPAYLVPSGGDARVSLHAGRYVVEWRTPLGELVERALELDAPGRATATQWVPAPPSSAAPMASARNGP